MNDSFDQNESPQIDIHGFHSPASPFFTEFLFYCSIVLPEGVCPLQQYLLLLPLSSQAHSPSTHTHARAKKIFSHHHFQSAFSSHLLCHQNVIFITTPKFTSSTTSTATTPSNVSHSPLTPIIAVHRFPMKSQSREEMESPQLE